MKAISLSDPTKAINDVFPHPQEHFFDEVLMIEDTCFRVRQTFLGTSLRTKERPVASKIF